MYLELRDVWKRYPNQKNAAIRGITLEIRAERITALAGESGSGKTTLLRLIAGFERPDRGVVRHNARVLSGPGRFVPPQKRSIAMIFQDLALFPHLCAGANVAFGMKGTPRSERSALVESLIESVGLAGYADKYPHELSGGQRQRVALARALASNAETILMDEPFSSLDPELKWRLMEEVRTLLSEAHRTVVFVTHDRDEAFALADDIAIVKEGTLLQYGDAREVYERPASHAVARFFGKVNRISASALGGDDPFEELLVRPEACRVESRNGSSGEVGALPGVVSGSRFMGEYWETAVAVEVRQPYPAEPIIVRDRLRRSPGETVWVRVDGSSGDERPRK